ncbi:hypothetical protein PUNSTDRAFT_130367 [Punctularia strigosozonata HHB-11173 SS5]|uniref:uncharacterized protein n=1 Tax=Punctularia strigosozonata (strain HHB-11173) TaxID=741275 RepID=UPI0004417A4F|nr:uncharacterized protein PUNSTDRAFT_130367 [Punctularia strigosozonata HHB-11173 SS5]EIN14735.1 hypothetical protein PUNSTDRAFT_130367 [Punctularia strigosozonata HHB-11173 SS5]
MSSRNVTPPPQPRGPSSAPVIYNSTPCSASRFTGEYTHSSTKAITKAVTVPAISHSLKGAMLDNVTELLDVVFPNSELPVRLDHALAYVSDPENGSDCLYREGQWTGFASLPAHNPQSPGEREEAVSQQFNAIADAVSRCKAFRPSKATVRAWTGHFATRPLGDTNQPTLEACQRQPDGVLLPQVYRDRPGDALRQDAVAFLEVKSGKDGATPETSSAGELKENVRLAFGAQYDRRFILGITLVSDSMRLWRFDRAGVLQSREFNIHDSPDDFLRVVCGFAFANRDTLGFDPTVSEPDLSGVRTIQVKNKRYKILDVLHMSGTLRGRGTIILRVRSGKRAMCIIKDSWVDVSRPEKECEILERASKEKIEGIVHMLTHERVSFHGAVDSTKTIREKLHMVENVDKKSGRAPETREHYRLVLEESGLSLRHFATRRELLSVLIDAVEAHRRMYEDLGVLHRDISFRNILILDAEDDTEKKQEEERPGRLIDFDYSKTMNRPTDNDPEEHKNHRSGTLPFMSFHLLASETPIEPEVHHDLESFFYVLIWACIVLQGPGRYREPFDAMATALRGWLSGNREQDIADAKFAQMVLPNSFERLLSDFHPYFNPLKPTLRALRTALKVNQWEDPNGERSTYDEFLAALRSGRDALPLVDDPPPMAGPVVVDQRRPRRQAAVRSHTTLSSMASSRGQKRSRQEMEDEDEATSAHQKPGYRSSNHNAGSIGTSLSGKRRK